MLVGVMLVGRLGVHPAAVRCDMVLHQVFRTRCVRKTGIGGEVRHGVTSDVYPTRWVPGSGKRNGRSS